MVSTTVKRYALGSRIAVAAPQSMHTSTTHCLVLHMGGKKFSIVAVHSGFQSTTASQTPYMASGAAAAAKMGAAVFCSGYAVEADNRVRMLTAHAAQTLATALAADPGDLSGNVSLSSSSSSSSSSSISSTINSSSSSSRVLS